MSELSRLIGAALVREFVDDRPAHTRSVRWFDADDLKADDPVNLPEGKVVRVTIEYVDADEDRAKA